MLPENTQQQPAILRRIDSNREISLYRLWAIRLAVAFVFISSVGSTGAGTQSGAMASTIGTVIGCIVLIGFGYLVFSEKNYENPDFK